MHRCRVYVHDYNVRDGCAPTARRYCFSGEARGAHDAVAACAARKSGWFPRAIRGGCAASAALRLMPTLANQALHASGRRWPAALIRAQRCFCYHRLECRRRAGTLLSGVGQRQAGIERVRSRACARHRPAGRSHSDRARQVRGELHPKPQRHRGRPHSGQGRTLFRQTFIYRKIPAPGGLRRARGSGVHRKWPNRDRRQLQSHYAKCRRRFQPDCDLPQRGGDQQPRGSQRDQ